MPVRTQYVLVDYENVQPESFSLLDTSRLRFKLFFGAHQGKALARVAASLQSLGDCAECIQLESSGKNALDFHIAYYLGQLSAHDPTAVFHIISKDKGFNPLIRHLQKKKIRIQRGPSITGLPRLEPPITPQAKTAIANLIGMKASPPRSRKGLSNTLHNWFKTELTKEQLPALLALLRELGHVTFEGNKVVYDLPEVASDPNPSA